MHHQSWISKFKLTVTYHQVKANTHVSWASKLTVTHHLVKVNTHASPKVEAQS